MSDKEVVISVDDSGVYRRGFGPNWRWWQWFSQQWSKLSLSTLALLGGWVLHQEIKFIEVTGKVQVLEERIEPLRHEADRVADLTVQTSGNSIQVEAVEPRVTRLENDYDVAYNHAGDPVPRRTHRKGGAHGEQGRVHP